MTNIPDHNLYSARPGSSVIKSDFQTVEWGREANASWLIGKSSNPVFFTADGHNARIEDSARGSSVLIVDNNADINVDLSNVHVWAIGEAISKYPCKIWTPKNENHQIKYWNNQSILKLMPLQMARSKRNDGKLISHSPNCFYYRRHSSFNSVFFLQEETIWNDGSDDSGVISSLQLAIILGYRKIYIDAKINANTKIYQNLHNISKLLIESNINVYSCNGCEIFPCVGISSACSNCILS